MLLLALDIRPPQNAVYAIGNDPNHVVTQSAISDPYRNGKDARRALGDATRRYIRCESKSEKGFLDRRNDNGLVYSKQQNIARNPRMLLAGE